MEDSKSNTEDLLREIEELKSEKEKYQLIADYTHDWEYWLDPKGKFNYISPGCKTLTGYPAQSFLSDSDLFYRLIHPEDLIEFKKYISESLQFTTIGQSHTFRIISKTMNTKYCMVSHKAVYDSKGTYLGQRGSIRDVSKLTEVLNQMKSLSESKTFEEKAKNKFKEMVDERELELTGSLIQMSEKNELFQYISNKLKRLINLDTKDQKLIDAILSKINSEVSLSGHWDEFKLHFESTHPGFFDRLISKYPKLSTKDLKICAYLRLRLSTKEMASLMNITAKSAEVSRVRLRKKLNLNRKQDLGVVISRI